MIDEYKIPVCPTCHGKTYITRVVCTLHGHSLGRVTCHVCEGTGVKNDNAGNEYPAAFKET
jgi:DnaJ-class molecular chaperone